jgi:hypothetical protein
MISQSTQYHLGEELPQPINPVAEKQSLTGGESYCIALELKNRQCFVSVELECINAATTV